MNGMMRIYILARCRNFVTEIFQLHQRFLIAFLFVFGLLLSGNEQIALKRSLARLLGPDRAHPHDIILGLLIGATSLLVSFVLRHSLRGGRIEFFVRSLPLSLTMERGVRCLKLGFINVTILILFEMALEQSIRDITNESQSWSIPLWIVGRSFIFYAMIIGLQLATLEMRKLLVLSFSAMITLWCVTKGQIEEIVPLLSFLSLFLIFIRQKEARPKIHFSLKSVRLKLKCPDAFIFHVALLRSNPVSFFYLVLFSLALELLLAQIAIQSIPSSQRIYVFAIVTGIVSLICGNLFRLFHQQRLLVSGWLRSLPEPEGWWLKQDTRVTLGLYTVLVLPLALVLASQTCMPILGIVFILGVHGLVLALTRRVHRLSSPTWNIPLVILALCWFASVAFIYLTLQGSLPSC